MPASTGDDKKCITMAFAAFSGQTENRQESAFVIVFFVPIPPSPTIEKGYTEAGKPTRK